MNFMIGDIYEDIKNPDLVMRRRSESQADPPRKIHLEHEKYIGAVKITDVTVADCFTDKRG